MIKGTDFSLLANTYTPYCSSSVEYILAVHTSVYEVNCFPMLIFYPKLWPCVTYLKIVVIIEKRQFFPIKNIKCSLLYLHSSNLFTFDNEPWHLYQLGKGHNNLLLIHQTFLRWRKNYLP